MVGLDREIILTAKFSMLSGSTNNYCGIERLCASLILASNLLCVSSKHFTSVSEGRYVHGVLINTCNIVAKYSCRGTY